MKIPSVHPHLLSRISMKAWIRQVRIGTQQMARKTFYQD